MCRSVPQTEATFTLTSTSSGPISGTGIWRTSAPGAASGFTTASMVSDIQIPAGGGQTSYFSKSPHFEICRPNRTEFLCSREEELPAHVAHAPDRSRTVIADEQRSIFADGDTHRPSPDLAFLGNEAGEKVFVVACGMAVFQRHADDFIAGALVAVPGTMFGGEDVAAVLFGKHLAVIKSHLQRGIVGLQDHVRSDDFVFQLRVLAGVARIVEAAHVIPRPAVEAAFLDVGNVVGNQVVAQAIALVGGAPNLAGLGMHLQPHAVADAVGIDAHAAAIRIEFQDIRAVKFLGIVVRILDVGVRSHRDVHLLAIAREGDVPSPVSLAAELSGSAGQIGNDHLLGSGRFQIANMIRKTDHGSRIAHVHPLRIVARRIKSDAKGTVEAGGKDAGGLGLAILVYAAKDLDLSCLALRQKEISVGRGAHQARFVEPGRVEFHLEAGEGLRHRTLRTRHKVGKVQRRRSFKRLRKVGDGELAEFPRLLLAEIHEGRLSGGDLGRSFGFDGAQHYDGANAYSKRKVYRGTAEGRHSDLSRAILEFLVGKAIRAVNIFIFILKMPASYPAA